MNWNDTILEFQHFLRLEKGLSDNSIEAYCSDIYKFSEYLAIHNIESDPIQISSEHIRDYINYLFKLGIAASSQARLISSFKAFYNYLLLSEKIPVNPAQLIESPKLKRKLPDVLTVDEIDNVLSRIDLSKPGGHRNKAIIETMYSCGLRVSEVINLKVSNLFLQEGFIKVTGKGQKERLVPIGNKAKEEIHYYIHSFRNRMDIKKEAKDILFLNTRGNKLSRIMIFKIIKELCKLAQIRKNVSPHTFRHSFATHLIEGGADLRSVQEMLGHESITTTEIYTHLDRAYLRDVIIQFHPRA
jgi:integrase/recombinase XerD